MGEVCGFRLLEGSGKRKWKDPLTLKYCKYAVRFGKICPTLFAFGNNFGNPGGGKKK